ncbi:MAG: tetratricopeptide repeat protein [Magnetospirillum sp.]|nr:MAG: tetratricopeptide repeat protein [Magnetospirillum sp.]
MLTRIAQHGDDRWLRQGLAVAGLTVPLVKAAMTVAVEVGDPLGPLLAQLVTEAKARANGIVNQLAGDLPEASVALSDFIAVVKARRVEFLGSKADTSPKGVLAYVEALFELANTLWRNGKPEEALQRVDHALTLWLERGKGQSSFKENWAAILNTKGAILSDLGDRDDAVEVAAKAEDLYRELATARPDTYRDRWAMALGTLGVCLSGVGRHADALDAGRRAEALYRELAASHPDAHRPAWANSLNNHGNRLSHQGHWIEALAAAKEAEAILRDLAAVDPDTYRVDWVGPLQNLGNRFCDVGAYDQALETLEQAVVIQRQLVGFRPQAHSLGLVRALGSLALAMLRSGAGGAIAPLLAEAMTRAEPLHRQLPRATANIFGGLHALQAMLSLRADDMAGATAAADRALEILGDNGDGDPAWVDPIRAVALAVRALAAGLPVAESGYLARWAFTLIEPHFRSRSRSTWHMMAVVVEALRRYCGPDAVPADIVVLLEQAQIPLPLASE